MLMFSSCSTTTPAPAMMMMVMNSAASNSVSFSSSSLSATSSFIRSFPIVRTKKNNFSIQPLSFTTTKAAVSGGVAPAIALTEDALKHLNKMRSDKSEDLCLRIGVKQGGCSGMSYTMEFESKENSRPDDTVMEYNGFVIVCDPKSLLFIFGMQLDFSDALIGGGFSFKNPNATQTCGCGKSFASEV